MKYLLLTSLLLYPFFLSSAQSNYGCKQIAMSKSMIAAKSNSFAIFSNPSTITKLNLLEIGLYYSPAPFGLKELSVAGGAAAKRFYFGSIGLGYTTYGFELYREQKIAISYANTINKIFSIGISAIYQNVSIPNYGTANSLVFVIGSVYDLTEDFSLAFSVFNPTRATYGKEANQIPTSFNFGMSYRLYDSAEFCLTNAKEIDKKNSLRLGLSFIPIKWIELQLGYNNYPESISAGFKVSKMNLSVEYAVYSHSDLGLTHQFGINFLIDQ